MAHFAGWREIGVKFPMRAASVDPKNTQHTPLTIQQKNKKMSLSFRPPTEFIQSLSVFEFVSFCESADLDRVIEQNNWQDSDK